MKRRDAMVRVAVGLLVLAGAGSGCMSFEPRPDPTVFYTLSGPVPSDSQDAGTLRVGVRRIAIPEYLDRPHLVTRQGENRIVRSEYRRWAEGFEASLKRAVGEHLAVQPAVRSVHVYPWSGAPAFDVTVKIRIVRFEGSDDGTVRLAVDWQLEDPAGERAYGVEQTRLQGEWTPGRYDTLVLEMDRLLARWAAVLAAAM